MQKYLLQTALLLFSLYTGAQTYTIGTQTITYTDPARSNRAVGVDFRYPGTNAALANGQFPFVIFAHGFSMDQTPYYPYADSLARRGYIVGLLTTETGFSPSHTNFAQDILFVYNKLIAEGSSNNASVFYQKVLAKGAIGGHSMGGGSTVLSAQFGNPETCCFTFSAATTNPSSITAAHLMTKPYLSFAGSSDCIAPIATNQQPMYDSSGSSCKFLINITGGLHCQYGNANVACSFGEGASGCASSTLTRQQQIDKTLLYLIPYLDYYLKGDCSAWTLFESRYASNTVDVLQRNCTNTIPSNPSISGIPSFCSGDSTTLTANPMGFHYLWSDNSGGGTLTVNTAGSFSVVVGNGTCVLGAVSVSVTQNFPPAAPSAIVASDTVCSTISGINISVTNDPAATGYNWNLPVGWNITSGANTHAIQATSGTGGGTISVTVQNGCGTATGTKDIVVIPSNLGSPGVITGPGVVCVGTSGQYSISPVSGADYYVWVADTSVLVSSAPSAAFAFSFSNANGTVDVQAGNTCGLTGPSSIPVVVHDVPSIGTLSGLDSVCLGTEALDFSVSFVADADTIVWYVTSPWLITAGQGSALLNVNSNQSNGTVTVYAGNECGSSQTIPFNVVYVDTPVITITRLGAVLQASAAGAVSYQWYKDGALQPGAVNAGYTPAATGNYSVEVTNQYGCVTQSSPFSFIYNGMEEIDNYPVSLFPNPTTRGFLQINVAEQVLKGDIKIFDAAGKTVLSMAISSGHCLVDVSALQAGLYMLQLEGNGKQWHSKVVVE